MTETERAQGLLAFYDGIAPSYRRTLEWLSKDEQWEMQMQALGATPEDISEARRLVRLAHLSSPHSIYWDVAAECRRYMAVATPRSEWMDRIGQTFGVW